MNVACLTLLAAALKDPTCAVPEHYTGTHDFDLATAVSTQEALVLHPYRYMRHLGFDDAVKSSRKTALPPEQSGKHCDFHVESKGVTISHFQLLEETLKIVILGPKSNDTVGGISANFSMQGTVVAPLTVGYGINCVEPSASMCRFLPYLCHQYCSPSIFSGFNFTAKVTGIIYAGFQSNKLNFSDTYSSFALEWSALSYFGCLADMQQNENASTWILRQMIQPTKVAIKTSFEHSLKVATKNSIERLGKTMCFSPFSGVLLVYHLSAIQFVQHKTIALGFRSTVYATQNQVPYSSAKLPALDQGWDMMVHNSSLLAGTRVSKAYLDAMSWCFGQLGYYSTHHLVTLLDAELNLTVRLSSSPIADVPALNNLVLNVSSGIMGGMCAEDGNAVADTTFIAMNWTTVSVTTNITYCQNCGHRRLPAVVLQLQHIDVSEVQLNLITPDIPLP
jgi:hypothetical protein